VGSCPAGNGPWGFRSRSFFELFKTGLPENTATAEAYDQLLDICRKAFGRRDRGVQPGDGGVLSECRSGPRAQYNDLEEKYRTLRLRVLELERELEALQLTGTRPADAGSDLMEKWTDTARRYTELNQKFFEELGKFFR